MTPANRQHGLREHARTQAIRNRNLSQEYLRSHLTGNRKIRWKREDSVHNCRRYISYKAKTSSEASADTSTAAGIGYSICESFAKAGIARIVIVQRREQLLAAAKETLQETFPHIKVETYAASQTDFPRMTEILKSVGDIDVLVLSATNTGDTQATKDKSIEDMIDSFTVNVFGLFHTVREFLALPSTAATGGPKTVIHVSSNAAQKYYPTGSAYCSSKAAATQLITHFAFDDPDGKVKFYSFHPGAIWTGLSQGRVPKETTLWEDSKSWPLLRCPRLLNILLTCGTQKSSLATSLSGLRGQRPNFSTDDMCGPSGT